MLRGVTDTVPDDEVRREWDAVIAEARSKWDVAREELERRRERSKERRSPESRR